VNRLAEHRLDDYRTSCLFNGRLCDI
jgi:hypothetical protein